MVKGVNRNPSVYTLRTGRIEATSKNVDNKKLAETILKQLIDAGYVSENFNSANPKQKKQLIDSITKHIKDQDNDGYKDINLKELADTLLSSGAIDSSFKGMKLRSNQFLGHIEEAISSSNNFDTYFDDIATKKSSSSDDEQLKFNGRAVIQRGLEHFRKNRKEYLKPGGMEKLRSDIEKYIKENFTDANTFNASATELLNAVNDHFSDKPVTDETLAQFSKTRDGKCRVDCAVYANIAAQMLKAAGMDVEIGWASLLENPANENSNGAYLRGSHIVVIAKHASGSVTDVIVVGNKKATKLAPIVTPKTNSKNDNTSIIHRAVDTDVLNNHNIPGMKYLAIAFGKSIAEANQANNNPAVKMRRLWNLTMTAVSFLNNVEKGSAKYKNLLKLASSGAKQIREYYYKGKINTAGLPLQGGNLVALDDYALADLVDNLNTLLEFAEGKKDLNQEQKIKLAKYFQSIGNDPSNIYSRVATKLLA